MKILGVNVNMNLLLIWMIIFEMEENDDLHDSLIKEDNSLANFHKRKINGFS